MLAFGIDMHTARVRRQGPRFLVPLVAWAFVLSSGRAWGALTGPVAGYTTAKVPTYVSMYEYVPAMLASTPSLLVVSHYCGGTAAGMFGVAEGGASSLRRTDTAS